MIHKLKKNFNRIRKSQDGRVLASNFIYLILLQIAGYVFPLLTIPYLARVIGVEGFGKIAFAAAVIMWFRTVSDWGFNYTATRDIARNREDLSRVSEIFSNVLWARLFLSLISLIMLFAVVSTVPYFNENQGVLFVTFLLIPGHIFFPDWFFQAMERMKFITFFDLISKAIFTGLVFIFIKDKSDFILQPLFISLGYLVSGFFSMYIIIIRWKVRVNSPKPKLIFSTIKSSTDVFLNNIIPNMYNSFSIVLLGFFGGSSANGLFDAGAKFANMSQQVITMFSRVFFPFLSRRFEKHSFYMRLSLLNSLVLTVILYIAAPLIIKFFYTPDFIDAVVVLKIMSLSLFFLTLSNVYGVNYMITHGHEKILRNITALSSVVGFFISIPLIYFYSYIGAAITITLTRCILGLSIAHKSRLLLNKGN